MAILTDDTNTIAVGSRDDLQQAVTGKRILWGEFSHNELLEKALERDEQCNQLFAKLEFYKDKFFEDSRTSQRLAKVESLVASLDRVGLMAEGELESIYTRLDNLERSGRERNEFEGA